ncbi:MAG: hypothetical protein WBB73_06575 [Candidatus Aminicenantaceae bacterium]
MKPMLLPSGCRMGIISMISGSIAEYATGAMAQQSPNLNPVRIAITIHRRISPTKPSAQKSLFTKIAGNATSWKTERKPAKVVGFVI